MFIYLFIYVFYVYIAIFILFFVFVYGRIHIYEYIWYDHPTWDWFTVNMWLIFLAELELWFKFHRKIACLTNGAKAPKIGRNK